MSSEKTIEMRRLDLGDQWRQPVEMPGVYLANNTIVEAHAKPGFERGVDEIIEKFKSALSKSAFEE